MNAAVIPIFKIFLFCSIFSNSVFGISDTLIIKDVNVIPMNTEQILKMKTVVIIGDRIVKIGDSNTIVTTKKSFTIDGRNKFLIPGLADMHTHVSFKDDLTLYLANGVTTIRNMNGRPFHLEWRKKIELGEMQGPTIYTTGPTLYGQSIDSVYKGIEAVRTHKKLGYDFIKVYHRLLPEVYDAIAKTANEMNIPVVGHKPSRQSLQHIIDMGQISLEHLLGYAFIIEREGSKLRQDLFSGKYSFRYSYGAVEIDTVKLNKAVKTTVDGGLWNCPTLVAMDRWVPLSSLEAKEIMNSNNWDYVHPALRSLTYGRYRINFSDWTSDIHQMGKQVRRTIVDKLQQNNAKLILGTDAGAAYVEPGFSISTELFNLTEAGLTPFEALRTGTVNVAEFLNAENEFGTIQEGKRADLVLLDANPLENVENIKKINGIIVRGKWISNEQLKLQLKTISEFYRK